MNPFKHPAGRLGYFIWTLIAWTPLLVLAYLIDQAESQRIGNYWLGWRIAIVTFFVGAVLLLTVRRLQSAGLHPLLSLMIFVPLVGFMFWIALFFIPPKHHRP